MPPGDPVGFFEAMIEIWKPYLWVFITSLLLTLIATPIVRRLAMARGIFDRPDDVLKPHKQPIPYLGGVALFIGVAAPLLIVAGGGLCERSEALIVILATAALMLTLGLLDDLKDISPKARIAGQVVCALVLAFAGIRFAAIPAWHLGDGEWLNFAPWAFIAIGVIVQIVLIVGASNAMNLLDGLDGLCSGVTVIISLAFLLLATHLVVYFRFFSAPHYVSAELIIVLSLAMLGAAVGFL
ncbi:MAG: MraY family glycosyltransferase, partial [Phycisphaerae bacterium]|nr:MraY family glycosyltransferase [Phycisphaerae bacterium]